MIMNDSLNAGLYLWLSGALSSRKKLISLSLQFVKHPAKSNHYQNNMLLNPACHKEL